MVKAFLGIIALGLGPSIHCLGQQDYVITNLGDTIRGTIHFNIYRSHPGDIRFTGPSGIQKVYFPSDLKEFHVSSIQEDFLSASVTFNAGGNTLYQLYNANIEDTLIQERVFLLILVRGEASLYFFSDSTNRSHYFLQMGSDPVKELEIYYNLKKGNPDEFITQDAYKTQLLDALGACPGIDQLISESSYSNRSLTRVCNYYNACLGGKSNYIQKDPFDKIFIHPGLFCGYASNLLAPAPPPSRNSPDPPTRQFIYGISLEYRFRPFKSLFSLYGDVHFKKYKSILHRDYIDFTYLVRAHFPITGKATVFLEGGGSSALANYDLDGYGLSLPSNTQFQWVSGAGVRLWKHFCLEWRYSAGKQIGTSYTNEYRTRSSYLLAGFQL